MELAGCGGALGAKGYKKAMAHGAHGRVPFFMHVFGVPIFAHTFKESFSRSSDEGQELQRLLLAKKTLDQVPRRLLWRCLDDD